MAKKKKLLKKLAKAALIGGALYGATKLGKRAKAKSIEGMDDASIGVKHFQDYITKKAKPKINISSADPGQHVWPNVPFKGGGRTSKKHGGRTGKQFGGGLNRRVARPIGGVGGVGAPVRPVAYKHGGKVKSMGIAKRGGGVAKR
jgi:hypothetical protein